MPGHFKTVLIATALLSLWSQPARAGVPLKGVNVNLGKNPGGPFAARTTDAKGQVNLGIWPELPKGQHYTLDFGTTGKPLHLVILGTTDGQIEGKMSADRKTFVSYRDPADALMRRKHIANIKWNERNSDNAGGSLIPIRRETAPESASSITFNSDGVHPIIVSLDDATLQ